MGQTPWARHLAFKIQHCQVQKHFDMINNPCNEYLYYVLAG